MTNQKELEYEELEQIVSQMFESLPDIINYNNIEDFVNTFINIDYLCLLNQNAFCMILPFHNLTYGWQSTYTKDFTWKDFLKDAVENKCTNVKKLTNAPYPCVYFNNNNDSSFAVRLVPDD